MKSERRFGDLRTSTRHDAFSTRDEPIAVGVPLSKLIKRTLVVSPELPMLDDPRAVAAERFRRLRTLLANQESGNPQVIVVTSGIPGDGKSTVAINLALAYAAERETPTLLLDADLRRPSIGAKLQPSPQLGLREICSGDVDEEHAILPLENTPLHVLPAVGSSREPTEILLSEAFRELMPRLRSRYRKIIIDTPPIVPFTDADVVGSVSDGILIVARAGSTPISAYTKAITAVTSTRILGVVLNSVVPNLSEWNQRYDSYYTEYYNMEKRK
jgi:capsular exopolysaccharide synthesis family protein